MAQTQAKLTEDMSLSELREMVETIPNGMLADPKVAYSLLWKVRRTLAGYSLPTAHHCAYARPETFGTLAIRAGVRSYHITAHSDGAEYIGVRVERHNLKTNELVAVSLTCHPEYGSEWWRESDFRVFNILLADMFEMAWNGAFHALFGAVTYGVAHSEPNRPLA